MNEKNDLTDISQAFLEGLEGDSSIVKVENNKKILDSDADYSVNLDEIESLRQPLKEENKREIRLIPTTGVEEYEIMEVPQKNIFEEIDVHLQDMIDKFFRNSERPIVIISDDKIVYANASFLKLVNVENQTKVLNKNFLEFVIKDYWNIVAEGIGEALTTSKSMQIGIKDILGNIHKINFDAIYIPDNHTFSFILVGEAQQTEEGDTQCLYDKVTGLPTYYLLEDRIQTIISSKNSRNISFGKEITALIGVSIDNINYYEKLGNTNLILKRLTSRVGLSLNKSYTLARGLKFQFWIFIPHIEDYESLNSEINKIKTLFDAPIEDNFSRYEIKTSIGVSTFPEPATSGKKLIEQAVMSILKAQKDGGNKVVIFGA